MSDNLYAAELESGAFERASDHDISGVGFVHGAGVCKFDSTPCCIHRPSEHALSKAHRHFRYDRGFMERICKHGTGHPDPDSLAYLKRVMTSKDYRNRAFGVHGCDGCCSGQGPA